MSYETLSRHPTIYPHDYTAEIEMLRQEVVALPTANQVIHHLRPPLMKQWRH